MRSYFRRIDRPGKVHGKFFFDSICRHGAGESTAKKLGQGIVENGRILRIEQSTVGIGNIRRPFGIGRILPAAEAGCRIEHGDISAGSLLAGNEDSAGDNNNDQGANQKFPTRKKARYIRKPDLDLVFTRLQRQNLFLRIPENVVNMLGFFLASPKNPAHCPHYLLRRLFSPGITPDGTSAGRPWPESATWP